MTASEGEQLTLFRCMFKGEPWEGRSPRALTRGYKALFLRREPQKSMSDLVSDDQLELWPAAKKAPWVYQGAPLLVSPQGRRIDG